MIVTSGVESDFHGYIKTHKKTIGMVKQMVSGSLQSYSHQCNGGNCLTKHIYTTLIMTTTYSLNVITSYLYLAWDDSEHNRSKIY